MKKKWDSLSENTKNIYIILFCISILFLFLIFNLYSNYRKKIESEKISGEIIVVKDPSRYFTVISCIQKYLSFVQYGTASQVLDILDDSYIQTFSISESNIANYIPALSGNLMYDYTGKTMREKDILKNVKEYYVEGYIQSENENGEYNYIDYNVVVTLNESNLTFSIRPGGINS